MNRREIGIAMQFFFAYNPNMAKTTIPQGLRVTYAMAVHDEKEEAAVLKVLQEHRTIMGPQVKEFEERTAKAFGKKFGVMVNSGSSANLIAIEMLNLPAGSEVITPVLTFATTVAPLVKNNLVPVFAEVVKGKYIIDADQVEKLITKKTKAIMVPLLFGNVPNMEKLAKIAKNTTFILSKIHVIPSGQNIKGNLREHIQMLQLPAFLVLISLQLEVMEEC
jgi:CDP-6-deoxy-D-xylo-4-hexulose-3-dehydrase